MRHAKPQRIGQAAAQRRQFRMTISRARLVNARIVSRMRRWEVLCRRREARRLLSRLSRLQRWVQVSCVGGWRSRLWMRRAMRLREIDRGDSIFNRLLIGFISLVLGMRLPDAARVAFYHKDFFGRPMGAWTQAAMRGPSAWSVGDRELMADLVAKWNSCDFSVGPHGAAPAKDIQRTLVAT